MRAGAGIIAAFNFAGVDLQRKTANLKRVRQRGGPIAMKFNAYGWP